jgi:hypothetical protein
LRTTTKQLPEYSGKLRKGSPAGFGMTHSRLNSILSSASSMVNVISPAILFNILLALSRTYAHAMLERV